MVSRILEAGRSKRAHPRAEHVTIFVRAALEALKYHHIVSNRPKVLFAPYPQKPKLPRAEEVQVKHEESES